jgi:hypothetical protein
VWGRETITIHSCILPLDSFQLVERRRGIEFQIIEAYCESDLSKVKYYINVQSSKEK